MQVDIQLEVLGLQALVVEKDCDASYDPARSVGMLLEQRDDVVVDGVYPKAIEIWRKDDFVTPLPLRSSLSLLRCISTYCLSTPPFVLLLRVLVGSLCSELAHSSLSS